MEDGRLLVRSAVAYLPDGRALQRGHRNQARPRGGTMACGARPGVSFNRNDAVNAGDRAVSVALAGVPPASRKKGRKITPR